MPFARETGNACGTDTPPPETTCDAFLDGGFSVLQPKARGNRSGMDALLLAASLPEETCGLLADLGAGAGVAGFAALQRHDGLNLLAVEKNHEMAAMARQSCQLEENRHLQSRIRVLEADVTLSGQARRKAGLENDSVDHVIMNPPYNTRGTRAPADAMRAEAFMMAEGGLDAWFRTAAAIVRPGGTMSIIYRTDNLGEVIACSQGRFGNLEIIPVHSREKEAAKRMIVRGICGALAPLRILPGFVIHAEGGGFRPCADNVFRGKAGLGI